MLEYIQVHSATKEDWNYMFFYVKSIKWRTFWAFLRNFLVKTLKNPPLQAFEWVCSHTHIIWETHFWEEWIEEKRKCCCGGRFVGNELEEWPRVSFLSPWLPKLWDGNVFVVERIRKWKYEERYIWVRNVQSRTFWRKRNVQKICNVQCLPNIYSKLICLILIVVN